MVLISLKPFIFFYNDDILICGKKDFDKTMTCFCKTEQSELHESNKQCCQKFLDKIAIDTYLNLKFLMFRDMIFYQIFQNINIFL